MLNETRNQFPDIPAPFKLAIIGEAPGQEEIEQGKPFVGLAGKLLMALMSRAGLTRQACFMGNISQIRPTDNNIKLFSWAGPEIQSGLNQLQKELQEFNPNLCLLLGSTAMYAATGDWARKPSVFRGSLFVSNVVGPFLGRKCMGTIHPAAVLRQLKLDEKPADQESANAWHHLLLLDLIRAKKEAMTPDLILPVRHIDIDCDFDRIIDRLKWLKANNSKLSVDIEGYVDAMSCIALAWTPYDAIVIPFLGYEHQAYWKPDQEEVLFPLLDATLCNSKAPKILQNALYDAFVLAYSYKIQLAGIAEDTMLKSWELLAELPKDLGTLGSVFTREPYWKHESKLGDWKSFLLYNGKDACVTFEISEELDKQLTPEQQAHYKFNVELLNPMLYCELKGMRYDKKVARELLSKVQIDIYERQHRLNVIAGKALLAMDVTVDLLKSHLCKKNSVCYTFDDIPNCVYKKYEPIAMRCVELAKKGDALTDCDLGELETLMDYGVNVDSSEQLCNFLYRDRGYPAQFKKEGRRLTTTETANELALLKLYVKKHDALLYDILVLKKLVTSTEALRANTDADGRIRCGYNVTGSVTGRLACYKSPTKSGYNLQTVTRKFRKLFRADDGYEFFDCDLSGADGWTVAGICAMLGDTTMLDDYKDGLKPANIVALMFNEGAVVNTYSREVLHSLSSKVDSKGWLYFTSKRTQHGTTYGMGAATMCDVILKDSYKLFGQPIVVEHAVVEKLQSLFHARYPGIRRYQKYIEDQIVSTGCLVASDGCKRIFLGNRKDYKTISSGFSQLPQHNTTNVLMRAIRNCWFDPENRQAGQLIVQPLHQVHDAFNGQWPIEKREWAKSKIHQWFDNPIKIGDRMITIPFEGAFGPSWGEKPNEFH